MTTYFNPKHKAIQEYLLKQSSPVTARTIAEEMGYSHSEVGGILRILLNRGTCYSCSTNQNGRVVKVYFKRPINFAKINNIRGEKGYSGLRDAIISCLSKQDVPLTMTQIIIKIDANESEAKIATKSIMPNLVKDGKVVKAGTHHGKLKYAIGGAKSV